MASFVRALTDVLTEEVLRHRALAPALQRAAVVVTVRDDAGHSASCTALLEGGARIFDGALVPPGVPRVTLIADEAGLRALFAGTATAVELGASGRLRIEGPDDLVAGLSACFAPGKNKLSVRFGR